MSCADRDLLCNYQLTEGGEEPLGNFQCLRGVFFVSRVFQGGRWNWVLVLFVSGGGEIESFALLNGNQEVVVPPVEWKTKGKFRGQTTRDTEEVQLVTGIQSKYFLSLSLEASTSQREVMVPVPHVSVTGSVE